jgi:Ca-activated chloride channel family protein
MVGQMKPGGSPEYVRPVSLNPAYGDGRPAGSSFKEGTPGGPLQWGDPHGNGIDKKPKGPFEQFPKAVHIVYVIDRSGSMIDNFDALREALGTAVSNLKQNQDFHIIMFSSGVPQEMSSRKLVEASVSNIQQAERFLEGVRANGDTDPLPALKRAFEVLAAEPEGAGLIQLLTDGEFPDNQKVVELIDKMNAGRRIHVNTYLYGPHSTAAQNVLQEIAGKNKGQYKYYSSM